MDLSWPPEHAGTLGAVLLAALVYTLYHYFGSAGAWRARMDADADTDAGALRAGHLQRVSGFVLLGGVPLAYAALALPRPLAFYGLGLGDPARAGAFVAGVLVVVLPVIALTSRKPSFREQYPQIRLQRPWTARQRADNAASWTLYLLGYEFLFRGLLLFALADAYGAWAAVALTTLAYVWAHLPKAADETLATLPMGIVFAVGALWTGAMWAPWLAHAVIANTAEWLATRERA